MANRLKYDEVETSIVQQNLDQYVQDFKDHAANVGGEAILFCTYTAMLKIRRIFLGVHSGLEEAEL